MKFKTSFFSILLVLLNLVGTAQTVQYKNEFGFRSDNDSYLAYGQDRYYTNGLFIHFRRATDQEKLTKKVGKLIWEVEAGQKMYNAQSGQIPTIQDVDRPFAAYLYLGGSLNFLYKNENTLKISLQAGTIGPDAKGEEAQEFMHSTFGFYDLNGWQWQVKNEAGLNASINYKHLLHRSDRGNTDFTIDSYANIGNTFAGAGTGLLFRAGILRPLYHSAITESTVSNNSTDGDLIDRELFFYARPMLHYVAYDATIEGGLFTKDKGPVTFDVKPLVFSQQAGVIYSKDRWTIDFSLIFKSRELKSVAKPHQYGSAALSYRFN